MCNPISYIEFNPLGMSLILNSHHMKSYLIVNTINNYFLSCAFTLIPFVNICEFQFNF